MDRTDDDVKECKRYKKDSFYWYKNVIATNGKNLEYLKAAPHLPQTALRRWVFSDAPRKAACGSPSL